MSMKMWKKLKDKVFLKIKKIAEYLVLEQVMLLVEAIGLKKD